MTTSIRIALPFALAAALAAPAHADDAVPSLTLVVKWRGIDPEALRARIAAELAAPVALAVECAAACIDVSVGLGAATVVFTPVEGTPRARIIALGTDRAQWPLVITLLVGNLARDEARDVLAGLPMPPTTDATSAEPAPDETSEPDETPEPDEAPEPRIDAIVTAPTPSFAPDASASLEAPQEHSWMLLGVGLTPGLSTDGRHVGTVNHFLAAHLLVGVSGGSSGISASGIVDVQNGNVGGFQLAGIAAVAKRVLGVQIGGIAARAHDLDGAQLGGIAAVADIADALQIGGIAAVADRASVQLAGIAAVSSGSASAQVGGIATSAESSEIQLAGLAAHTSDDAGFQIAGISAAAGSARVQVAGIASSSGGDVGIQAAGIASVAGTAHLQVAGLVSVADRVEGVQIAPINVAAKVSGVQIGLINIGGSAEGFSFGLINIVPGGRYDLEAAVDSSKTSTLLFRHGGRGWHNVYGIAGHPVDEQGPSDDVWMYGLGFGPSWRLTSARIDLEALGWQVNHGARHSTDISILTQLRLSIAYGLGPIAIVAGGALNAYISDDLQSPLILERRTPPAMETSREVTITKWPSVFVGVRL